MQEIRTYYNVVDYSESRCNEINWCVDEYIGWVIAGIHEYIIIGIIIEIKFTTR